MNRSRFTLTSLVAVVMLVLGACSQTSQPTPDVSNTPSPQLPGSSPRARAGDAPISSQADVVMEQLVVSFRTCGGGSNFGQTFAATATGEITSIALAPDSNVGAFTTTLRVLNGARTTLLHSQQVTLSDSGGAFTIISLSTPVPVISGQVYAFDISVGCANGAGLYGSTSNVYANGAAYSEGTIYSGDMAFRIAITPDSIPPSVTLNQASGQTDPTNASPINFTAVFSEPVSGLTGADVTLGGTAGATTSVVTGGPSTFNIAVSGMTTSGTAIASIDANKVTDIAGNSNTASTSTNNTVTYNLPDTTAPLITPTITGTLGNNGWYTSDVNVSWTITDAESTISSQTGCDAQSVTSDTSGVTFTCSATSAGGTDSKSVTIKRDATNPSITFANRTPANLAGWNNSNVVLNWNCTDATSGVVNAAVSQTVSTEGANLSSTGTCTDNAGNSASNTQTGIKIDKTAPTLNPVVSPNPVLLNASASVVSNAADSLSGLASQSCGALNTSSVGSKSVSCTATDNAGNSASKSVSYQVIYNFVGFQQPVDNLPTLNQVKAGQAIPVKFSLTGNQGLNIFAAGSPSSQSISCSSSATVDDIEQTLTSSNSSLQYDATSDTYTYVWKTDKAWSNTCRQLLLTLADGMTYKANFKFK